MRRRRKQEGDVVRFKRSHHGRPKKAHAGTYRTTALRLKCKGGRSIASQKFLPKHSRTRQCAFCGRRNAKYKCRGSCGQHLCLQTPKDKGGIKFSVNGPTCYMRHHGFNSYPAGWWLIIHRLQCKVVNLSLEGKQKSKSYINYFSFNFEVKHTAQLKGLQSLGIIRKPVCGTGNTLYYQESRLGNW